MARVLKETTERLAILQVKYPDDMRWILIEKGECKGWFFKYYMIFCRPGTNEITYYKCTHGEYSLWLYGDAAAETAF